MDNKQNQLGKIDCQLLIFEFSKNGNEEQRAPGHSETALGRYEGSPEMNTHSKSM